MSQGGDSAACPSDSRRENRLKQGLLSPAGPKRRSRAELFRPCLKLQKVTGIHQNCMSGVGLQHTISKRKDCMPPYGSCIAVWVVENNSWSNKQASWAEKCRGRTRGFCLRLRYSHLRYIIPGGHICLQAAALLSVARPRSRRPRGLRAWRAATRSTDDGVESGIGEIGVHRIEAGME